MAIPSLADLAAQRVGSPLWWVNHLSRELDNRRSRLREYENYFLGDHNLAFATKKFRDAFGTLFSEYAENVCQLVVEAVNERLHVVGFRMGADSQPEADRDAWRIWQANQLDAWQEIAHETALVKEESYLAVWSNPRDPRTPQITVEDPLQVIVERDPANSRERLAALKRWWDPNTGRTNATLYLPNETYKFQSRQTTNADPTSAIPYQAVSANPTATAFHTDLTNAHPFDFDQPTNQWEPRTVDGELWPLPNPLRVVPVVPLTNRPRLGGGGVSELKSVIPINNAINKLVSDMLLAAEFGAFRQKYALNIVLETNPDTGKPVEPWQIAVDKLLVAPPPQAGDPPPEFGEFSQTDLAPYVKAIEQRLQMIATITRTPPHYILGSMGTFPSGESITATEAGLLFKARAKQMFFGEGHEEAMRLAFLVLGDARGNITDSEAIWRDPERRTESQHVDALVKMGQLGVPDEVLWEKWGASPQEVRRWKAMRAAAERKARNAQPSVPQPVQHEQGGMPNGNQ